MRLSGSISSGGVGVGVGLSFGGGGGSPSVGALRSTAGRVGCGVGVDVAAGAGAGVAGVGVGLGAWVVRGRSWSPAKTLDPKIMAETIKPQIARIAVRLTFCVLNNGKNSSRNRAGWGKQIQPHYAHVKRCGRSDPALPNAQIRSRSSLQEPDRHLACSCRLFPVPVFSTQRAPAVA